MNKVLPPTAVSRNCWFSFLRVHEKRLSLTENNQFAGFATVAKPRHVIYHFKTNDMKKIVYIFCLITSFCFGQKNNTSKFEDKYNLLMENLSKEDWVKSEILTNELLQIAESIDSMQTEKKVLRYIYIYSTAGLLNEKKLSKIEALKKIEFLKSKEMIMPAHPFNSNCYVNCTHLNEEEPNTFFSGVNNAQGTQIFSFEYVKIENGIKETKSELEGKYIVLKGILNEMTVEGNILPRFNLKFTNGEYIIQE